MYEDPNFWSNGHPLKKVKMKDDQIFWSTGRLQKKEMKEDHIYWKSFKKYVRCTGWGEGGPKTNRGRGGQAYLYVSSVKKIA